MHLETQNLILKLNSPNDAEKVLQYYKNNSDFLEKFEPYRENSFYTVEEQYKMLEADQKLREQKLGYRFNIFCKESEDEIIGMIALSNIVYGAFLSCHLGYKLDFSNQNKGFMTEAVKKITEFAFFELNLHRIEANVMPKNLASIKVLEKCNFKNEGISPKYLRINGIWEDHIHMVILNQNM